ncbi:MAG: hypothetical protein Q9185_005197 [Variospora sp. 1 TL-2023]
MPSQEYGEASMTERTKFTKPMLQRMMTLKQSGLTNRRIFAIMQEEYGVPQYLGEINAELHLLNAGPRTAIWNDAMEARVLEYYGMGMDSKDITTELFHEFAKPDMWQETYRKIQQMKLQGRVI